jgi:predicted nucleic acid-binding protein
MVAVDSSAIIPLIRIGKLSLLEKYFKKIKISREIYYELISGVIGVSEIEKGCKSWIIIYEKLNEVEEISELDNIGLADASIILLAQKEKDIILSGDYMLINVAKSKGIECMWLTAFIIKCAKKKIINKIVAKEIMLDLIRVGMRLNNQVYSLILKKIEEIK